MYVLGCVLYAQSKHKTHLLIKNIIQQVVIYPKTIIVHIQQQNIIIYNSITLRPFNIRLTTHKGLKYEN